MALMAWDAAWKAFCALKMSTSSSFWFTPEIVARLFDAVVARFVAEVAVAEAFEASVPRCPDEGPVRRVGSGARTGQSGHGLRVGAVVGGGADHVAVARSRCRRGCEKRRVGGVGGGHGDAGGRVALAV